MLLTKLCLYYLRTKLLMKNHNGTSSSISLWFMHFVNFKVSPHQVMYITQPKNLRLFILTGFYLIFQVPQTNYSFSGVGII